MKSEPFQYALICSGSAYELVFVLVLDFFFTFLSCFRLIFAPISHAPKDIAVLIMEMISAANAQEVAMDRIVIKCHER